MNTSNTSETYKFLQALEELSNKHKIKLSSCKGCGITILEKISGKAIKYELGNHNHLITKET